jgi:hypothetical protein
MGNSLRMGKAKAKSPMRNEMDRASAVAGGGDRGSRALEAGSDSEHSTADTLFQHSTDEAARRGQAFGVPQLSMGADEDRRPRDQEDRAAISFRLR